MEAHLVGVGEVVGGGVRQGCLRWLRWSSARAQEAAAQRGGGGFRMEQVRLYLNDIHAQQDVRLCISDIFPVPFPPSKSEFPREHPIN